MIHSNFLSVMRARPSSLLHKYFSVSWLPLSLLFLLAGCATNVSEKPAEAPAGPSAAAAESSDQEVPTSGFESDLLLDLLVSSIAQQRGQDATALESLSRAAYQSRDRRIISSAINLATELGDYQQATDLAKLLNTLEPDNYRVLISLANSQFKLGENTAAIAAMAELASTQGRGDIHIFQAIASLLAQQDIPDILTEFEAAGTSEPANIGVVMTASMLASMLDDGEAFTRLIDQALLLEPDWEIPAMLKLTFMVAEEDPQLRSFAENHLAGHPDHDSFRVQYARILIQNDDLDGALEQLEIQLSRNPESGDALYTAGLIYLDQENPEKAGELLRRYVEIRGPNSDQARIYLADIASDEDELELAAKYLNAVSSYNLYLDAQIRLAGVLARKDTVEAGLRHLSQIEVESEQDKTRIILESEMLLRDFDRMEQSLDVLDDGLERFPDNPELLYNRGILAAQMDLLEVHEKDMRRLIALQPENAHAYNALGYTLADKTDRLEEAMALIVRANELLPNNAFILDSLGWVHFRLGNNEEALKYLRQALDSRPDAEIAAHLGEVLWEIGKKDEAREIWKRGTELGPDNAVLRDTIDRLSDSQSSEAAPLHDPSRITLWVSIRHWPLQFTG